MSMISCSAEYFLDRDQFIKFFFNMASDLRENLSNANDQAPVFIVLNGQGQSGKELVALAFDMAFHPEKFPESVIDRNVKADFLLHSSRADYIHFVNAQGQVCETSDDVDIFLQKIANQAPQSQIHFVSNLKHVFARNSDDKTILNSQVLDMAVIVTKDDDIVRKESGLDANTLHKMLFGFRRTCSLNIRPTSPLAMQLK